MSKMMANFAKHRFKYADMICQACKVHFTLPRGKQVSEDQMIEFFNWGFVFILKETRL